MDAAIRGLTVREAAKLVGVSPDTVRRWADAGRLASYRLPSGHRRFDQSKVERFRDDLLAGRLGRVR